MAGKLSQLLQGMEEEAPKKKAKSASMEVELEMPEEADADMPEDEAMEDEDMEAESEAADPLMDAADEDLLMALEARGLDVSAVRKQLEAASEEA